MNIILDEWMEPNLEERLKFIEQSTGRRLPAIVGFKRFNNRTGLEDQPFSYIITRDDLRQIEKTLRGVIRDAQNKLTAIDAIRTRCGLESD